MKVRALFFLSVVLMVAYLLPNHYVPWLSFHQELLAAIAFIPLVTWSLVKSKKAPPLVLGAFFLSLIPLIQLFVGEIYFSGDAWISWLYIFGFALAAWAGTAISYDDGNDFKLAKEIFLIFFCILFASLASIAIALHQWLGVEALGLFVVDLQAGARPYANLAQANHLATLLLVGIVSVIFLYENNQIRGVVASASALLLILGMVMTQSRTVLLAGAVTWVAFFAMGRRVKLKMSWGPLAGASAFFLICSLFWPKINDLLLLPSTSSLAGRLGQDLRVTLWASMLDAMGRSPWVGYGWNQVSLAQQATVLDHPATHWFFNSSHNIFLDLALWAGLPVALMVLVGLMWWFVQRIRYAKTPSDWCLLLAVSFIFSHAMVEYPLSYAYFLLPIGLMMGAMERTIPASKRDGFYFSVGVPLRIMGAVATLVVLILVVLDYFPIEQQWRDIRFNQVGIGAASLKKLEQPYILNQLSEDARLATVPATRAMSADQLEWMRKVSGRFAWAASSFKYAQALALNGEPEAATVILSKLCKIQPPATCRSAIKEWGRLASGEYPELQRVTMPDGASL